MLLAMADLDLQTAYLKPRPIGGHPEIFPARHIGRTIRPIIRFASHWIVADGGVKLGGRPGEDIHGWELGYIQLALFLTDYARYRGKTVAEGSVRITRNVKTLSRDTHEKLPSLWYDSVRWGIHKQGPFVPRGTRVLPPGTTLPKSGEYEISAGFGDAPYRSYPPTVRNTATGFENFIYHADIGLQFCTMLTARNPRGHYHVLKHFYWNVRWEAHFLLSSMGRPQVRHPVDHLKMNIEHHIHSGVPKDPRFHGRVLDKSLPITNTLAERPGRVHAARDWSEG